MCPYNYNFIAFQFSFICDLGSKISFFLPEVLLLIIALVRPASEQFPQILIIWKCLHFWRILSSVIEFYVGSYSHSKWLFKCIFPLNFGSFAFIVSVEKWVASFIIVVTLKIVCLLFCFFLFRFSWSLLLHFNYNVPALCIYNT